MKDIGIARPVDRLGRIVIPKSIIKQLDIKNGEKLDIYLEGTRIILEKTIKRCASCGSEDNLAACGDIILCFDCADRISKNILSQREG